MAGHSKWANIRIRKGKQDSLRGNLFTKLSRELIVAAKLGGADPEANNRLRTAVAKARASRMPNDAIKRAIEKGAGGGEGTNLEEALYEGKGPGGVGIIVKCLTDNKNRTVPEVRHAFSKGGGTMVDNGAVSWQFKQRGEITVPAVGLDEEAVTLAALDAGAEDVVHEDSSYTVVTAVEALHSVQNGLAASGIPVEGAELVMNPLQIVEISRDDAQKLLRLLERLDELDDVQDTYFNADLPADLE